MVHGLKKRDEKNVGSESNLIEYQLTVRKLGSGNSYRFIKKALEMRTGFLLSQE